MRLACNGTAAVERELAALSGRTGVAFDVLLERHERGLRGDQLVGRRMPNDQWISNAAAAASLGLTHGVSHLGQIGRAAIGQRSRALREGASARGVGLLCRRSDVEAVRQIMDECQMRPLQACRVWAAIKQGRIDGAGAGL